MTFITTEQAAYHRQMRVTLQMPRLSDGDCMAIDQRLGEVARTLKTGGAGMSVLSLARSEARSLIRQRLVAGKTHHLCAFSAEEVTQA